MIIHQAAYNMVTKECAYMIFLAFVYTSFKGSSQESRIKIVIDIITSVNSSEIWNIYFVSIVCEQHNP